MEIKFFCTFLFYLAFFRGDCNAEYNISEQLQISTNILRVYNRDLDSSIKWEELKSINLNVSLVYHTNETIPRMEKIRDLLHGAADSYFESSYEVYDWVSYVISKLTAFKRLQRQDVISGRLIVGISPLGKEKAEKSIEKLMAVRRKFSNASVECKSIIPYFDMDELKKTDWFGNDKNDTRLAEHLSNTSASLNVSASLGGLGGVLGTLILPGVGTALGGSLAFGAGQAGNLTVIEFVFSKRDEKELHDVRNYFKKLYQKIDQAAGLIDDVVEGVKSELAKVADLKSEAVPVATVVEAELEQNKHLVDGDVEQLLDQCNKYKLVHEN